MEDTSFWEDLLHGLSAPRRWAVSGIDRLTGGDGSADSVDALLGRAGMEDGFFRNALGFVGDIAADPLTYAMPWAAGKAALKLFPSAAKGVTTAGEAVSTAPLEGLPSYLSKPINVLDNAIPVAEAAPLQLGYTPYANPFYSRLMETVGAAKQEAMPGSQWINYLKGKGIKDEEIDLFGRELFGSGKVAKADLLKAESPVSKINLAKGDGRQFSGFRDDGVIKGYQELLVQQPGNAYKGAHWEEPGVFAHLRTTERAAGGKPVMFAEEFQSDLHQAARKAGYQNTDKAKQLASDLAAAPDRMYELAQKGGTKSGELRKLEQEILNAGVDPRQVVGKPPAHVADLMGQREKIASELRDINSTYDNLLRLTSGRTPMPVPQAPMSEDWPLFMLKNLLRQGAESGSDRVAWNLGSRIQKITGGELAGQQEFYDKLLPSIANKYVKKWGVKTEPLPINFAENPHLTDIANVHSIPITQAMREEILFKGQPLMKLLAPLGLSPFLLAMMGGNEETS